MTRARAHPGVRIQRQLVSMRAPGEPYGVGIAAGRGAELTLDDGRTVVDAGSMSSSVVGHTHPDVVAAITRAASLPYANDQNGLAIRERAAQALIEHAFAGEDWAQLAAFFVSSSEAADLALVLAQMLTGRDRLVARPLAYHGGVGLAREVSTHPGWGAQLVSPDGRVVESRRYADVRLLPMPRCGTGPVPAAHDCKAECLIGVPAVLDGAAAYMLDHTQGGVSPSAAYQDGLAESAADAGTLWVADETVTGFGRTGRWFGFQRGARRPALVTLGKGMTGGAVGGGALILSRDVVEAIGDRRWVTASTYRGNALTAAATVAVVEVIEREGLVDRAKVMGTLLGRLVAEVAAQHPCVESVGGEGMVRIVRLRVPAALREENYRGGPLAAPDPATVAHLAALDAGAYIGILGTGALWVIPPLVIDEAQLDQALRALDFALGAVDAML